MDGYWDDVDKEILELLKMGGPRDPADLARALRMSEGAVCTCVAMLAEAGKVRILSVEATAQAATRPSAA